MAYTPGNKCAKNICKRAVLVEFIIENVVTGFFSETQCIYEVGTLAVDVLSVTFNTARSGMGRATARPGPFS